MSNLAVQHNNIGLTGWFGNLLKGVATAVGGMVGGVVGAAVVAVASYGIDRYINGNENAVIEMFGYTLYDPNNHGMNGLGLGFQSALQTDLENAINNTDLQKWVNEKFRPYILELGALIQGSENKSVLTSSAYRAKVNQVLESLSVAAVYYEKSEIDPDKKLSLAGLIDFDEVEVNTASKATVIYSFLNAIKEAYILALKEQKINPSVTSKTIKTNAFTGKKVEYYSWPSDYTVEIESFIEPGTGVNPTSVTGLEIEDLVKSEEPVSTPILTDTKTPNGKNSLVNLPDFKITKDNNVEVESPTQTTTSNKGLYAVGLTLFGGAVWAVASKAKKKK